MEAARYRRICELIDQASPHRRRKRQQFSDAVIVKVFFFSTCWDRPVSWACEEQNWHERVLCDTVGTLPSQPTISRRLRTASVLQLIERVQVMLCEALGDDVVKTIDSKPLKVGNYSRDRDALRGRAAGEIARGYKLHAICCGKSFKFWTLTGMNSNDQVGAAMLLPKLQGWGYVTADNGYDANPVHTIAAGVNHQLVAPPRRSNAEVRDVQRNSPQRIRALDICANPLQHCGLGQSFGASLRRQRDQIERNFGNATMTGLGSPPPWVRRPHRVAAWAAAKLVQRMVRQVELQRLRSK